MALLRPWWLSKKAETACEMECTMPRPPELKACAAMYWAFIMPSRALRLRGSNTASRRFFATSSIE